MFIFLEKYTTEILLKVNLADLYYAVSFCTYTH